jgi:mannose-6-phosphate isomerase-like protein (cupin superfamily)
VCKNEKEAMINKIFPEPIRNLPVANIPLKGIKAYLSQSENHQILFMQFSEDVDLPEHSHATQVGIVLEGKIDIFIGGKNHTFSKGDRYYIPEGTRYSGKAYSGYADITFFAEPTRYAVKEENL